MSKELEEMKKSIANNPTMKKWAKQTAEAQKTIADAINNSKGIHSLDAFYDTPKIIHKPPVDIDEKEWKEIKSHYRLEKCIPKYYIYQAYCCTYGYHSF